MGRWQQAFISICYNNSLSIKARIWFSHLQLTGLISKKVFCFHVKRSPREFWVSALLPLVKRADETTQVFKGVNKTPGVLAVLMHASNYTERWQSCSFTSGTHRRTTNRLLLLLQHIKPWSSLFGRRAERRGINKIKQNKRERENHTSDTQVHRNKPTHTNCLHWWGRI